MTWSKISSVCNWTLTTLREKLLTDAASSLAVGVWNSLFILLTLMRLIFKRLSSSCFSFNCLKFASFGRFSSASATLFLSACRRQASTMYFLKRGHDNQANKCCALHWREWIQNRPQSYFQLWSNYLSDSSLSPNFVVIHFETVNPPKKWHFYNWLPFLSNLELDWKSNQ